MRRCHQAYRCVLAASPVEKTATNKRCILLHKLFVSLIVTFASCGRSGFDAWLPDQPDTAENSGDVVEPNNDPGPVEEVNLDSDGDGWSNVDEIACGSDPLQANSVPFDSDDDGACDTVQVKMSASVNEANDYFGGAVSISGPVAIVGAPGEDGSNIEQTFGAGAAYVFQQEGSQWVEKQKLSASDAKSDDFFGWSVSISGNVAIVGSHRKDGGNGDSLTDAGAAYIFVLENGHWMEKQKLTASDARNNDWFGWSVSISGNVAIVGSYRKDGDGQEPNSNVGAAYIFALEENTWVEKQKLMASVPQADSFFGYSVSISKEVAIIGAYLEDGDIGDPGEPLDGPGAAYIFTLENGVWVQKQKLRASDSQRYDYFGNCVSISGDLAIVGAYREDGLLTNPSEALDGTGAAYIFALENGTWIEKQKIVSSDAQNYDWFGYSVSLHGRVAVIGAYHEDGTIGDPSIFDDGPGAAYIFSLENELWVEKQKLVASDSQDHDRFGFSVSIGDSAVLIGANGEDGGIGDSISGAGAVYFYQLDL